MKNALQIYGQLRTFEKCLPSLLKFIRYEEYDFDVFLLIDPSHNSEIKMNSNPNFSQNNLEKLKNILGQDRIKVLKLTEQMTDRNKKTEEKIYNIYLNTYDIFQKKFYRNKLVKNNFTPRLMYRKYLLNEFRKEYEEKNNICYDYVIRTRFDIGKDDMEVFDYKENNIPVLCSDILTIAKPDFVNCESKIALSYPYSPMVFFDKNLNVIKDKINKYIDWRGDKFWDDIWLFMPELNQRLFLLENNFSFNEAWWFENRNFNFKIIRK